LACTQFIDVRFDCNVILYLLTQTGGTGVGLHFPGCSTDFNLELKFAAVIKEYNTFQVWGTTFSGRDFKTPLLKLVLDESCEAFFVHYLLEIHGDHAQTQLISANYKLVALEKTVVKKVSRITRQRNHWMNVASKSGM
jgi:hypothetical protein